MIVWFDLETTGLDFADDVVLEVAAIATDESLALESEPFHALIRPDAEGLGRLALTPVVAVMHANSGLLADLFGGEVPFWNTAELIGGRTALQVVDTKLCEWFTESLTDLVDDPEERIRLGGSGVDRFDSFFLLRDFPEFFARFDYRTIDISPMRNFAALCGIEKPEFESRRERTHRALDDVVNELDEARAWRQLLKGLQS